MLKNIFNMDVAGAGASCNNSNSANNNNNSETGGGPSDPASDPSPPYMQQYQAQVPHWKLKVCPQALKALSEAVDCTANSGGLCTTTNCNKPDATTPTATATRAACMEASSLAVMRDGGGDGSAGGAVAGDGGGAGDNVAAAGAGGDDGDEKIVNQNGTSAATGRHGASNRPSAHATITPSSDIWPLTKDVPSPADPSCDNECCGGADGGASALLIGAMSLTPPDHSHSNRTSMNSTDNLSYCSDNYFPEDLGMLDEDDDGEGISINSDDCVYAYRGDGAEYDIDLDAFVNRRGCEVGGLVDDETDFLEMDFEPDPLSEIEFGIMDMSLSQAEAQSSDALLFQRNACHSSGRRSASMQPLVPPMSRPLFSSPIDDMQGAQSLAAQPQAMLSKHLALTSLNLDQIAGDSSDNDGSITIRKGDSVTGDPAAGDGGMVDGPTMPETQPPPHASGHAAGSAGGGDGGAGASDNALAPTEPEAIPVKNTGTKPKRLSTFSNSSSTSSKHSSKSRSSLRTAYASPLFVSNSFDERSVSCSEFGSVPGGGVHRPSAPPAFSNEDCYPHRVAYNDNANDEFCLDCVEKEFLADTIGKELEPRECARCRRRPGDRNRNNRHRAYMQGHSMERTRCRSGSPNSFLMEVRDDCLYGSDATHEFLQTHRPNKRTDWQLASASSSGRRREGLTKGRAEQDLRRLNWNERRESRAAASERNQRRSMCDTSSNDHLLRNYLRTEPEIATISTLNVTEEILVQALDKLRIAYNMDLLKLYFKPKCPITTDDSNSTPSASREYESLKHFILHESKKPCNPKKVRRVLQMATNQRLNIQFKPDTTNSEPEMVAIKVSDILEQWKRNRDLDVLKLLDQRFIQANVLGKVANIIRQMQSQRDHSTSGALPEYIYVPQYYASGFLLLSKKLYH